MPHPLPPADTPQEKLDNRLHLFLHTHRQTLCRYFQSCGLFNGYPQVLFHLRRHPGMSQKALAEKLHVAAATLSVSLKRFEAAGLVERRVDETDARRVLLYLTAKGEELDDRCAKGRDFLIDAQFADFSDDDLQTLERLLTRMTDNLERACATLPTKEDTP